MENTHWHYQIDHGLPVNHDKEAYIIRPENYAKVFQIN